MDLCSISAFVIAIAAAFYVYCNSYEPDNSTTYKKSITIKTSNKPRVIYSKFNLEEEDDEELIPLSATKEAQDFLRRTYL